MANWTPGIRLRGRRDWRNRPRRNIWCVIKYQTSPLGINLFKLDLIRSIYDPEHPNTLEELRVVSASQISIAQNKVTVEFTPTVPVCGMSTLIGKLVNFNSSLLQTDFSTGLSIRVRLIRSLPSRFKLDIFVKPGSHQSELTGKIISSVSVISLI